MKWTLDQAIQNWHFCFTSGYLTAARAWWSIVEELRQEEQTGSLSADVAAKTYPIFGRFCEEATAAGLPSIVIDLGARMVDDLAAALAA